MHAIANGREKIQTPNLKAWLRHGEKGLEALNRNKNFAANLPLHNRLSQINVLKQIENLKSYPIIQEKLAAKELKIHGWWFELANASVHFYDKILKKFVGMDEEKADQILESSDSDEF